MTEFGMCIHGQSFRRSCPQCEQPEVIRAKCDCLERLIVAVCERWDGSNKGPLADVVQLADLRAALAKAVQS